jgi:hypothetical protein
MSVNGITEVARTAPANPVPMPDIMEAVLMAGDLAKLTPPQRISYYGAVCESLRLNPLTKPFDYISLNSKLTLYATKNCTDQLRARDSISIKLVAKEVIDGVYIVTAEARTAAGRTDESTGAVPIDKVQGEARANCIMKAETKAKRRVTLSLCGLGFLDESEIDSVSEARRVTVDMSTGEIDTGGHPVGTQAAADYVAQRRITEMKRAAVPEAVKRAIADPPKQEPQPVVAVFADADAQKMFAQMTDIKSTLKVFANLKKNLMSLFGDDGGARCYYSALGRQGVEHANEFKSTKPARMAALEMLEAVRAGEQPATVGNDALPDEWSATEAS